MKKRKPYSSYLSALLWVMLMLTFGVFNASGYAVSLYEKGTPQQTEQVLSRHLNGEKKIPISFSRALASTKSQNFYLNTVNHRKESLLVFNLHISVQYKFQADLANTFLPSFLKSQTRIIPKDSDEFHSLV